MPPLAPVPPGSRLTAIVTFVVVTGILYFGREVLIPLALSVLLSFLLAPAVRLLERVGLPRVVATTVVAALSFGVIGGVVWITASQFLTLAASLPEYKYNIQTKINKVQRGPEGSIGKATRTIKEIGTEIAAAQEADKAKEAGPPTRRSRLAAESSKPVPVTIETPTLGPLELIREWSAPLLAPLTMAAAVIIFTFIMLVKQEDLRDRAIRLIGRGELNRTTQLIEEAGDRVSRYLRMQLIVNASYGVPVGIALYFIGVPNAALWGLLATTLRFIPYIGSWIAAAMPVALAFAISDGWSLVIWTLAVFVVLELISNNIIEPWLYGASTGLSALAIMAAAIFWTWLWGAVGLLLATPLTVCLVVLGRHLPQLAFLNVMLGDEPVLSPQDRFYQRLLALDQEEATELAEDFAQTSGLLALYDNLLIPALDLAERDRHENALTEERKRSILDTTRRLIEEVRDTTLGMPAADSAPASEPADRAPAILRQPVCVLSARDEADELVGAMLQHALEIRGVPVELVGADVQRSELVNRVTALAPSVICISALPPAAVLHAAALCKRLRNRLPHTEIVIGLWHPHGDISRATQRLDAAGATRIVTTLEAALARTSQPATSIGGEPPSTLVPATP
ncbi:MAG: AI-2E family transporter [Casimicrobiaceae bacterium]